MQDMLVKAHSSGTGQDSMQMRSRMSVEEGALYDAGRASIRSFERCGQDEVLCRYEGSYCIRHSTCSPGSLICCMGRSSWPCSSMHDMWMRAAQVARDTSRCCPQGSRCEATES